jgi:hypothetical protein
MPAAQIEWLRLMIFGLASEAPYWVRIDVAQYAILFQNLTAQLYQDYRRVSIVLDDAALSADSFRVQSRGRR